MQILMDVVPWLFGMTAGLMKSGYLQGSGFTDPAG
jgi:hypothetical protein